MNGVTQHAKPVTVGQPPMNNMPVGECSDNALSLLICDFCVYCAAQIYHFWCTVSWPDIVKRWRVGLVCLLLPTTLAWAVMQLPRLSLSICFHYILWPLIEIEGHRSVRSRLGLVSLSSDRQHLSCDVCLEVRGEIIRTVLFCIVYWSCAQSWAHLDEQFLQFSRLGFVTLGPCHCAYCIYVILFWAWWDGPDGIEA